MTGDREREAGAPAPAGGTSDASTVGMDDGQTQSAATTITRSGVVTADEGLEDVGRHRFGYPRPLVLDAERERLAIAFAFNAQHPGRCITARVFQQRNHDLADTRHEKQAGTCVRYVIPPGSAPDRNWHAGAGLHSHRHRSVREASSLPELVGIVRERSNEGATPRKAKRPTPEDWPKCLFLLVLLTGIELVTY